MIEHCNALEDIRLRAVGKKAAGGYRLPRAVGMMGKESSLEATRWHSNSAHNLWLAQERRGR